MKLNDRGFHFCFRKASIYEVYLKSNETGCAVWAMDERGISGFCYHLTGYVGSILQILAFCNHFIFHFFYTPFFRSFSSDHRGTNDKHRGINKPVIFAPFEENSLTSIWNISASVWRLHHVMHMFGLVSLFNGMSTFVGYLMPKPSFEKNSGDAVQPIAGGIGGSCLSQEYLSKSERNRATGVRIRSLRFRGPSV